MDVREMRPLDNSLNVDQGHRTEGPQENENSGTFSERRPFDNSLHVYHGQRTEDPQEDPVLNMNKMTACDIVHSPLDKEDQQRFPCLLKQSRELIQPTTQEWRQEQT